MRMLVFAFLAAAVMAAPTPAAENCGLKRIASLDLGIDDAGGATVPAAIKDKQLTLLVDTAGYVTSFTQDVTDSLGIQTETEPGLGIYIYGGIPVNHVARIPDFTLGHLHAPALNYPILPKGFLPPDLDGILAPDLLANFDLDFDFAGAKLNLFSPDHCEGKVVYWTHDPTAFVSIPIRVDQSWHMTVPVKLDGKDMKAVLDTGAHGTLLSLDSAEDAFDLDATSKGMKKLPRGPNGTKDAYAYPFKTLAFANVEVSNPDVVIVPDSEARMGPDAPDMIIGVGILRQLHFYIDYKEKIIVISAATAH